MKFLVVCAFLSLAVCDIWAEVTKEGVAAIATACKEEAGASDADFEAMIKHQPADTKEGKCMRACAFKKIGVMDDEGKIIKGAAIELTKHLIKDADKKDLATAIIETCEDLDVSDDHCEAAEEYGQCARTEFEKKGITALVDLTS